MVGQLVEDNLVPAFFVRTKIHSPVLEASFGIISEVDIPRLIDCNQVGSPVKIPNVDDLILMTFEEFPEDMFLGGGVDVICTIVGHDLDRVSTT